MLWARMILYESTVRLLILRLARLWFNGQWESKMFHKIVPTKYWLSVQLFTSIHNTADLPKLPGFRAHSWYLRRCVCSTRRMVDVMWHTTMIACKMEVVLFCVEVARSIFRLTIGWAENYSANGVSFYVWFLKKYFRCRRRRELCLQTNGSESCRQK